jgi:outer membrane protein assembly factor BamB
LAAQNPFTVRTNWSQFHYGPQHRGYNPYENVLSPSTVAGLEEAWQYTTEAPAYSSPAVANGMIYFYADKLYALDAATGAFKWSYAIGFSQSSPVVANGMVYMASNGGKLYALDAATGAFKWSYAKSGWTSPVVANGIVYFGSLDFLSPDGRLYALDAQTGAFLWSHAAPGWERSRSPAVANGIVYHNGGDCGLYAYDAASGAVLWRYPVPGTNPGSLCPVVANGVVYVAFADRKLYALDALTGAFQWSYTGVNIDPPAVANGIVYVGCSDGKLRALDASTGAIRWTYAMNSAFPVVANGVVYVASPDDNSYDRLYALNAQTGHLLWRRNVSLRAGSPIVADGWVYVASNSPGRLHAYRLNPDGVYRTIIRRPDPAELIPDLSLQPQVGKGTIKPSEEVEWRQALDLGR